MAVDYILTSSASTDKGRPIAVFSRKKNSCLGTLLCFDEDRHSRW